MKVGILTYHRAENYGALLQAFALKTYIKSLGHNVVFVDYWPEYHVEHYRIFSFKRFKTLNITGKIKYLLSFFLWGGFKLLRKKRLIKFMREKLGLNKTASYNDDTIRTEKYDLVVYGSDQIWRKQDINNNEYNPWYFGSSIVDSSAKISYAASMGVINADESDEIWLKKHLTNFDDISIREHDLKLYLDGLGINAKLVIDPVFLLTKDDWRSMYGSFSNKGGYVLFYNLLNSPESVKFANAFSKRKKLPIYEINMSLNIHNLSKRYIHCASVEQFLQLIDGADYVISNSFHGVAFSLIFQKQFWAVGIGQRANRVLSLLDSVNLQNRYVHNIDSSVVIDDNIDFDDVSSRLLNFIGYSKDYLNKYLA